MARKFAVFWQIKVTNEINADRRRRGAADRLLINADRRCRLEKMDFRYNFAVFRPIFHVEPKIFAGHLVMLAYCGLRDIFSN